MRNIPAAKIGESCLSPIFPTIYKFGPIRFSDKLMTDGSFCISKQNKVTKIFQKSLLTVIINARLSFKYSLNKKKRKLCILFDDYIPYKDNHFSLQDT